MTPGNVHEGRAGSGPLPDDPGTVYAESAYRGEVFGSAVKGRGGTPRIVLAGMSHHQDCAPTNTFRTKISYPRTGLIIYQRPFVALGLPSSFRDRPFKSVGPAA